ncbi:MAG: hypothetical protein ABI972_11220 [Acidobacteriota bacterium]
MRKSIILAFTLCIAANAADWKYYCFGFLNAAPDRKELPKAEVDEIQKGHIGHMGKMAAAGKLLVAGPFMTDGGPRGVVIYNCASVDEAMGYTQPDPAVVNKRLTMEFYKMHAPEGLGEPLASKMKADPNYKYEMTRLPLFILNKGANMKSGYPSKETGQAHYQRSLKLMEEGKLRFFGRFEDAPEKLGVYVFAKMPIEEAKALMDDDPLVAGGYARAQGLVWFVADEAVPGSKK